MESLLLSTDPKMASAQVNAFKALLEARGKMLGKNQQVRFLDAAIEKMSERELDKLIGKVEEKPSVDD
jgi:L-serine deaminase